MTEQINDTLPEKRSAGRPEHVPTDENRAKVEALAHYGLGQKEIASHVGLAHKTLMKHYNESFELGRASGTAKVAGQLYKRATEGEDAAAVTAAVFWLKSRAGWKETSAIEHAGPDGKPIPVQRIEIAAIEPRPLEYYSEMTEDDESE